MSEREVQDSIELDGVEYAAACREHETLDGWASWAEDVRVWERAICKLLVREGARGPQAFKMLRKHLKLKQDDLSHLLGHNRATVRRWETGEVPVPVPAWATLAFLLENPTNAEKTLRAALTPPERGRKFVA